MISRCGILILLPDPMMMPERLFCQIYIGRYCENQQPPVPIWYISYCCVILKMLIFYPYPFTIRPCIMDTGDLCRNGCPKQIQLRSTIMAKLVDQNCPGDDPGRKSLPE